MNNLNEMSQMNQFAQNNQLKQTNQINQDMNNNLINQIKNYNINLDQNNFWINLNQINIINSIIEFCHKNKNDKVNFQNKVPNHEFNKSFKSRIFLIDI